MLSRKKIPDNSVLGERMLFVLFLGLVSVLCLYNLRTYPRTWWDEGKFVQIPTNLVRYGKYATLSSEGFRMFSVYGTGPAALLPIALAFKLFGIGLLQARFVMVGFTVVAVAAFHSVAKRLYNSWVALAASALLVLVVYDDFASLLFLGRQVLGEVPAFSYLMLGCAIWLRQRKDASWGALVAAGVFWGLATLAKWIFLMTVPCLLVLWIADARYLKKLRHRHFVVPILMVVLAIAVWFGYVALTLGVEGAADVLLQMQDNMTSNVFFISWSALAEGAKFLVRSQFVVWGLPGIVYILLLNLSQWKESEPRQWFLPVLVCGWLVWYILLSLGWSRQAFVPLAISHLFTAKLLYDVAGGFALSARELIAGVQNQELATLRKLGVILTLSALLVAAPFYLLKGIFGAQDTSAQEFAAYIDAHVPQDAVIESYEYELDILTHRIYHHPPETLVTLATKHVYSGEPYPPELYDFWAYDPTYLVLGKFAKWTGIYSQSFSPQDHTLVKSIGEYDLYKLDEYR